MTSHFPLSEAAVFSGRMFTHASSNCYASPVLSELCLTPWRKVFNTSPYLKLTFTQLSGVTPRPLLLLSWEVTGTMQGTILLRLNAASKDQYKC